jgi:hypothetical protein
MSAAETGTAGLREAIDIPDLRWVRFFNGRLLTGEDLDREQVSNRAARRLLGQAAGAGVAWGLEAGLATGIESDGPVLGVEAGVAVAASGDVLELPTATMLALTATPESNGNGTGGGGFATCQPQVPGTYTVGTGIFILTIGPASSPVGRAPVSGLPGTEAACNVAYTVEGVQFNLCRIAIERALDVDADRLRNRIAHAFFGSADGARLSATIDPFAHVDSRYGLLDQLPAGCIAPDQVPLAIVHWTSDGVRFVDRWAVRRRVTQARSARIFGYPVDDRPRSEAEAMFLQFEEELEELRDTLEEPENLAAVDRFEFLPPAGLLPVAVPNRVAGFRPDAFFGAWGSRDVATIDAERVAPLLRDSLGHEPIVVGGERVQLYRVIENDQGVAAGGVDQPVVLFAKRTLPYSGIARFGIGIYGRSRFAPRVI